MMSNRPWLRPLVGIVIVVLLCIGGYYRWNRLVIGVVLDSDATDCIVMCGIRRSDLARIPHSRKKGFPEINLPISEWEHDIPLQKLLITGDTMGTWYSLQLPDTLASSSVAELAGKIDKTLHEVNRQMSTWDPDSEISRFNQSAGTNTFAVSRDFAEVVDRALEFSRETGGAFDPTLQPLLNLWGFGSGGTVKTVPSDEALRETRALTGWKHVTVVSPDGLRKSIPDISLALGAIAKGYGVDAVGRMLVDEGLNNWFIEIGGEVLASGMNPDGDPWKIGIQYPRLDDSSQPFQGVVHLSSGAVATSGDYYNRIEKDGVIYSHILDPRSGRTVLSSTASVSVCAPNCTDADAAATALFVMGPEEGLAWIEEKPEMEALFLLREEDGAIIEIFSSGFRETTGYTEYEE